MTGKTIKPLCYQEREWFFTTNPSLFLFEQACGQAIVYFDQQQ